jgi:hypothetical protein
MRRLQFAFLLASMAFVAGFSTVRATLSSI